MTDASRLHQEAVVVDAHNDLVLSITAPGLGERGTFKHRWLPELRAAASMFRSARCTAIRRSRKRICARRCVSSRP
jgi:hypothetical protein